MGKLVFFTALGTPNNGVFDMPLRDITPLVDRNKASDNGWSSCASCHPDGLSDGVTWLFPTGPRQTVPLDAFFAPGDTSDQRISNWNAVRGSIADFNNNSRNVQGGEGFADDPAVVFNHGPTTGVSDALDAMTEWVGVVRPYQMPAAPDTADTARGREVFQAQCASCHGGAKWTKSQVVYPNNPTFDSNPLAGGVVLDSRITNAGPQIVAFENGDASIRFLEDVGSFDAADPLEIRGAGGAIGTGAVGGLGFNVPSLLSIDYHAPYFHNGAAQTLETSFEQHNLGAGSIATTLEAADQEALLAFLKAIDADTPLETSDTDAFLAGLDANLGAHLGGAQEVPAVATDASGAATVTVNDVRTEVGVDLEIADITGVTQIHIHAELPGFNGPVIFFLCTNLGNGPDGVPACPSAGGIVSRTLTAADFVAQGKLPAFDNAVLALLAGNTYINVHTEANPSGEIRGQIGPVGLTASLDGEQEVPPVTTEGSGAASVRINAAQTDIALTLDYDGVSPVTQAHIHAGALGENGPIIFFLCTNLGNGPAGVTVPECPLAPGTVEVVLTAADFIAAGGLDAFGEAIDALIGGSAYINVHTDAFASGEIRGQIVP